MTLKSTKNTVVGQSLAHDSAHKHVSGEALYVDDIHTPSDCLHLQVIRASIACGRITHMDLSAVRASKGVQLVLTAEDIEGSNDISPTGVDQEELLSRGDIHFYGQVIAIVAADTREQALKAAQKAKIKTESANAILDVKQAMAEQSFVLPPRTIQIGDAPKAMTDSTHVIEDIFSFGGQDHFYLEGQVSLALKGEDNDIIVHTSSQHPSEIQALVAKNLSLAMHQVTVEVRRMGGAFGGKETQAAQWACLAALVCHKTGRAAKIRLDRDDDMALTGKRHGGEWHYQIGFDGDGKISAVMADVLLDCGFSADLSGPICDRALFHADNAYYLSHARLRAYPCRTNKVSMTAFRGFGGPQGVLFAERMIEAIAQYLKIDPQEVREKNFYPQDEYKPTPYHQPVKDSVLFSMSEELKDWANYDQIKVNIDAFNKQNKYVKQGVAITPVKFGISFTNTGMNQAGALVHLYTDGSILINHGGTEMGQGLYKKMAQIAAEIFCVTIQRVQLSATNTSKVANTQPTAASAGADLNGKAIENACMKIKQRLINFICQSYGVSSDQINFSENEIWIQGHPAISLGTIAHQAHWARVQLWDSGFYKTPDVHFDTQTYRGEPFYYFSYGQAISVAEIDVLTGENKQRACYILHDVGQSLNPALDLGQIEGGFIQGMGWLTTEELRWDDHGQLKTHAPSTYKIPTLYDMPDHFETRLFKNENKSHTIYRSKAVGEPPLMLGVAAFQAISQAILSLNPEVSPKLMAPATPENVLKAIQQTQLDS